MSPHKKVKLTNALSILVLGATLVACSWIDGRETGGQYAKDTEITNKIKADILADSHLKVLEINVETMKGTVQLSGFVDSIRSETQAVSIAHHVDGVVSVKDALVVR